MTTTTPRILNRQQLWETIGKEWGDRPWQFIHIPKTGGRIVWWGLSDHLNFTWHHRIDLPSTLHRACFVRNPYDRAASLWRHYRKFAWAASDHTRTYDFDMWCEGLIWQRERAESLGSYAISNFERPMTYWTDWREMDFVGRFEHLERDYALLRAKVGAPPAPVPDRADTAPDGPQITPFARSCIEIAWAMDFEVFGY